MARTKSGRNMSMRAMSHTPAQGFDSEEHLSSSGGSGSGSGSGVPVPVPMPLSLAASVVASAELGGVSGEPCVLPSLASVVVSSLFSPAPALPAAPFALSASAPTLPPVVFRVPLPVPLPVPGRRPMSAYVLASMCASASTIAHGDVVVSSLYLCLESAKVYAQSADEVREAVYDLCVAAGGAPAFLTAHNLFNKVKGIRRKYLKNARIAKSFLRMLADDHVSKYVSCVLRIEHDKMLGAFRYVETVFKRGSLAAEGSEAGEGVRVTQPLTPQSAAVEEGVHTMFVEDERPTLERSLSVAVGDGTDGNVVGGASDDPKKSDDPLVLTEADEELGMMMLCYSEGFDSFYATPELISAPEHVSIPLYAVDKKVVGSPTVEEEKTGRKVVTYAQYREMLMKAKREHAQKKNPDSPVALLPSGGFPNTGLQAKIKFCSGPLHRDQYREAASMIASFVPNRTYTGRTMSDAMVKDWIDAHMEVTEEGFMKAKLEAKAFADGGWDDPMNYNPVPWDPEARVFVSDDLVVYVKPDKRAYIATLSGKLTNFGRVGVSFAVRIDTSDLLLTKEDEANLGKFARPVTKNEDSPLVFTMGLPCSEALFKAMNVVLAVSDEKPQTVASREYVSHPEGKGVPKNVIFGEIVNGKKPRDIKNAPRRGHFYHKDLWEGDGFASDGLREEAMRYALLAKFAQKPVVDGVEQESLVGQFDLLARMLLLCFGVAPCDIYPFEPKDPLWGTGHGWEATIQTLEKKFKDPQMSKYAQRYVQGDLVHLPKRREELGNFGTNLYGKCLREVMQYAFAKGGKCGSMDAEVRRVAYYKSGKDIDMYGEPLVIGIEDSPCLCWKPQDAAQIPELFAKLAEVSPRFAGFCPKYVYTEPEPVVLASETVKRGLDFDCGVGAAGGGPSPKRAKTSDAMKAKDVLDDPFHSIVTIGVSASKSPEFIKHLFQLADAYEMKASAEEGQGAAEEGQETAEEGQKAAEEGQKAAEEGQETAEEGQKAAEEAPKEKTVYVYIAGDLQNVKCQLSHFRVRFQIREDRAADFMRAVNVKDARFSIDFAKVVEGGRLDRFHVMVSRNFVQ